SQRTQLVTVPATDDTADAEFRRSDPDLALLGRLTTATGGTLNAPADTLLERQPGTRRAVYPLAPWLVPLAMLLFLADTALRLRRRRRWRVRSPRLGSGRSRYCGAGCGRARRRRRAPGRGN